MNSVRKKNGGFTLMEILIVVAIIAVLVAVAIPTFSGSLHKARVAADEANVRAYYAQLQAEYMLTGEYDPDIGTDIGGNAVRRSLTFSDGSTVELHGSCMVIRAYGDATGYLVTYICDKQDYCTLTLGATG